MKNIGWCLEKIQIAMAHIPKEVILPEDKNKAINILIEVQKYTDTLAQLIQNPEFQKNLNKLEKTPIEGIRLQAHETKELLKDLEHMLYVLKLYMRNLRKIIVSHPNQWYKKADQLVLMIDQKFGGEMGELRKEFQIALHTKEELKQLITSEKHLAEFLG